MKNDLKNIMLNWLINLFFPSIAEFMMSGPSVIGIISGSGVIKSWRDMMGATNPGDAAPGTIRGDFATAPDGDMIPNIVHGSDSDELRFGLVSRMDLKLVYLIKTL